MNRHLIVALVIFGSFVLSAVVLAVMWAKMLWDDREERREREAGE